MGMAKESIPMASNKIPRNRYFIFLSFIFDTLKFIESVGG
jgi:hypothetical protein